MKSKISNNTFLSYAKTCILAMTVLATTNTFAADLENGKKLASNCALCHGYAQQGGHNGTFPRLSGLPTKYIFRQTKRIKKGERLIPSMYTVSMLHSRPDEYLLDVAAYLSTIDLDALGVEFDIPTWNMGDIGPGKELYKENCKDCHKSHGRGKASKGIPPLAGQYTEYLLRQIDSFKAKDRHHDNDPEDETFDELKLGDLHDIMTYISQLDDK